MVACILVAIAPDARGGDGTVLRAVGWFKGKAEITAGRINCEIPTVGSAISEGSFTLGLWNTYGTQTIEYPDPANPYGNPCGVWLQLANGLATGGVSIDRVELRFRLRNAPRFLASVPTQRSFPYDCRSLRRRTVFLGGYLAPTTSSAGNSSSGAPNVAFVEVLPLVPAQLIACLRAVYTPYMAGSGGGLQLVARAVATGTSDAGRRYRSNAIGYTLLLRHSCGNGRVDDGEACDATAPDACRGVCTAGRCSQNDRIGCATDGDCTGRCLPPDDPSECTCNY